MGELIIKPMQVITNYEYIYFWWYDITGLGDDEMMMVRGRRRTPKEALEAEREFKAWLDAEKVMQRSEEWSAL